MPEKRASCGSPVVPRCLPKNSNANFNTIQSSTLKRLMPTKKRPSLGSITLPNELLLMVLLALPYESLMAFMIVNSTATGLVSAISQLRLVRTLAGNILYLLWKAQLHDYFSISAVYTLLTTPSCSYCNSFGAYVYLLGLVRCCDFCSRVDSRLVPITKNMAQKKHRNFGFNLTGRTLATLPVMTVRQVNHPVWSNGMGDKKIKFLLSRVLAFEAMQKQLLRTGSANQPPMTDLFRLFEFVDRDSQRGNPVCLLTSIRGFWRSFTFQSKASLVATDLPLITDNTRLQRIAMAPMPYLDMETHTMQEGLHCRGCLIFRRTAHKCNQDSQCFYHRNDIQLSSSSAGGQIDAFYRLGTYSCNGDKMKSMKYLPKDIIEHFAQCKWAKRAYNEILERESLRLQIIRRLRVPQVPSLDQVVAGHLSWIDPKIYLLVPDWWGLQVVR